MRKIIIFLALTLQAIGGIAQSKSTHLEIEINTNATTEITFPRIIKSSVFSGCDDDEPFSKNTEGNILELSFNEKSKKDNDKCLLILKTGDEKKYLLHLKLNDKNKADDEIDLTNEKVLKKYTMNESNEGNSDAQEKDTKANKADPSQDINSYGVSDKVENESDQFLEQKDKFQKYFNKPETRNEIEQKTIALVGNFQSYCNRIINKIEPDKNIKEAFESIFNNDTLALVKIFSAKKPDSKLNAWKYLNLIKVAGKNYVKAKYEAEDIKLIGQVYSTDNGDFRATATVLRKLTTLTKTAEGGYKKNVMVSNDIVEIKIKVEKYVEPDGNITYHWNVYIVNIIANKND
jgi:hypothetical protein